MTALVFIPAGRVGLPDGSILTAPASGWALAPDRTSVRPAADAGAVILPPVLPTCTTANRPTTGLLPALNIFDSTLGKPIWRNAANSGWVDATGGAV